MLPIWVERTPDPDTSGYRCAKSDPRYPTRLSAKVLISWITCLCHFLYVRSLHGSRVLKIAARSINWLQLGKSEAENIEEFIQPALGKSDPDPVLISAYVPDTRHRFTLFVPPLVAYHIIFLIAIESLTPIITFYRHVLIILDHWHVFTWI